MVAGLASAWPGLHFGSGAQLHHAWCRVAALPGRRCREGQRGIRRIKRGWFIEGFQVRRRIRGRSRYPIAKEKASCSCPWKDIQPLSVWEQIKCPLRNELCAAPTSFLCDWFVVEDTPQVAHHSRPDYRPTPCHSHWSARLTVTSSRSTTAGWSPSTQGSGGRVWIGSAQMADPAGNCPTHT